MWHSASIFIPSNSCCQDRNVTQQNFTKESKVDVKQPSHVIRWLRFRLLCSQQVQAWRMTSLQSQLLTVRYQSVKRHSASPHDGSLPQQLWCFPSGLMPLMFVHHRTNNGNHRCSSAVYQHFATVSCTEHCQDFMLEHFPNYLPLWWPGCKWNYQQSRHMMRDCVWRVSRASSSLIWQWVNRKESLDANSLWSHSFSFGTLAFFPHPSILLSLYSAVLTVFHYCSLLSKLSYPPSFFCQEGNGTCQQKVKISSVGLCYDRLIGLELHLA